MVLIEFNVKWLVTCNNVSKLVSLQDCSDLKQDKLGNTHFNSKKKKISLRMSGSVGTYWIFVFKHLIEVKYGKVGTYYSFNFPYIICSTTAINK